MTDVIDIKLVRTAVTQGVECGDLHWNRTYYIHTYTTLSSATRRSSPCRMPY